jgi:hypothetical protein
MGPAHVQTVQQGKVDIDKTQGKITQRNQKQQSVVS